MGRSQRYKFGRINILNVPQPGLYSKPEGKTKALLKAFKSEPKLTDEQDEVILAMIANVRFHKESKGILLGSLHKKGDLDWPHLEGDDFVESQLPAHPYSNFVLFIKEQTIALQSSRVTKSLRSALYLLDNVLRSEMEKHDYITVSSPLFDAGDFRSQLQDAKRIFNITFNMIPPNSYRQSRAKDVAEFLSSGQEGKIDRVKLSLPASKGASLSPKTDAIDELIEACEDGNGDATADILRRSDGAKKRIGTQTDEVVEICDSFDPDRVSADHLRRLLENAKEGGR